MGNGQVALQLNARRIASLQLADDLEIGSIFAKRAGQVMLGDEHVTHLLVKVGQIPLPVGIGGIGGDHFSDQRLGTADSIVCAGKIVLKEQYIAEPQPVHRHFPD